jgi:hypothetical protein
MALVQQREEFLATPGRMASPSVEDRRYEVAARHSTKRHPSRLGGVSHGVARSRASARTEAAVPDGLHESFPSTRATTGAGAYYASWSRTLVVSVSGASRRVCGRHPAAPRAAPRTSQPTRTGRLGWPRTSPGPGRPGSKEPGRGSFGPPMRQRTRHASQGRYVHGAFVQMPESRNAAHDLESLRLSCVEFPGGPAAPAPSTMILNFTPIPIIQCKGCDSIFYAYLRSPQNFRQLACHAATTLERLIATRN